MEDDDRHVRAFGAMKALGIPNKESRQVLWNLLDVFEWNWEHIEAEDYRALKDAYFEFKENQSVCS